MIKCKICGSDNLAYEPYCQECSSAFTLADVNAKELLSEAKSCMTSNEYSRAVDIYKFLAELGDAEGSVELASILERGVLVSRDLDMAMRYFYFAAKAGNAYSAYRYSRLISRANELAGGFWLEYSAMLGCEAAYADAYEYYTRLGDESTSSYYCSLVAKEGETDAIVEMARRHLYGTGVEQSEEYAKWYMDKLSFPPLYAMKLANRLFRVKNAKEPPVLSFVNRDRVLRRLIFEAKNYELSRIITILSELFAESEAPDASVNLASLYIEGEEFEQNVELGISLLEDAVNAGSSMGAKCLGDLFASGKYVERDLHRAIDYYRQAASLGTDCAFEALGDIFYNGELTPPEVSFALSLYERGAAEGDKNCKKKALVIKQDRERDYYRACEIEESSPEEAFILFEKSVNAGYIPAHAKIAPYFENGIGTRKNRRLAFYHYKTAVLSSDSRAVYDLGRCYANGIGTAFNFNLASEYLSLAKENGVPEADKELFRIYENKKKHMIRSLFSTSMRVFYQGKQDTARELLEVCAGLGSLEAAYSLGCMYEFGITVPADRKAALLMYKKTFAKGYRDDNQAQKQRILKMSKRLCMSQ